MADVIKGILQVKKGDEYVPMYPTTTAEQVKDFSEAVRRKTAPVMHTAQEFAENDPVIPNGVRAIETDTGREKIGDGVSKFSELSYLASKADALDNIGNTIHDNMAPVIKTKAAFEADDPVIAKSVMAVCSDGGLKVGDGETKWSELPYLTITADNVVGLQKKLDDSIQIIRDSRANFAIRSNPIPNNGLCVDETGGLKLGDGETLWNDLVFLNGTRLTLKVKQSDGSYVPV
jgi:hypothetical protein